MNLAGVVVLYNPDDKVVENIQSYVCDLDVLYLVDNSSKNNYEQFKRLNKIEYIPLLENTGIAKALNIGAKKALKDGYKWLLTMDQDSVFEDRGVLKMKQYIQKHDFLDQTGVYSPFHSTAISKSQPLEIYSYPVAVMTSGNIVNLSIYEKIGGFKEWMFIDCVDFDFCLNIQRHGYKITQINKVILQHGLGDYTLEKFLWKQVLCDNHSAVRRYYIVRNGLYLNSMYKDYFPGYCKMLRKDIRTSLYIVPLCEKGGWKKFRFMMKGIRDYRKCITGKINI